VLICVSVAVSSKGCREPAHDFLACCSLLSPPMCDSPHRSLSAWMDPWCVRDRRCGEAIVFYPRPRLQCKSMLIADWLFVAGQTATMCCVMHCTRCLYMPFIDLSHSLSHVTRSARYRQTTLQVILPVNLESDLEKETTLVRSFAFDFIHNSFSSCVIEHWWYLQFTNSLIPSSH
jgi:hypothetical protein